LDNPNKKYIKIKKKLTMKWKKVIFSDIEKCVKDNKKGLKQKDIDARLGISKNTLNQSIRKGVLKLSVFQDLCEILEINPCRFFTYNYDLSEEDELIANDRQIGYDSVPREMYDEMKQQLQGEIHHLREMNLGLIGHKRQTGT
jgi:DNA-binding Xre family transcriptional regulator